MEQNLSLKEIEHVALKVLRGCVPKLLVYASQFSEQVSDAEGFGGKLITLIVTGMT